MTDNALRLTAFFAVLGSLLNAGFHFQNGHAFATLFFMSAAVALTIVSHLRDRRPVERPRDLKR